MDRTAQRRGKVQKFKEDYLNPGGALMEHFSPEFQELMDDLRQIDDEIREIAVPEGDKEGTLKDLLKVAKANQARKEYMTAVSFLGRFHDKLEVIDNALAKLKNKVDAKHYEFLFGDMEPTNITYLTKDLSSKFEKARNTPTGIQTRASLDKEAGIVDWWQNISSDRGRGKALAAWEKRFPQYVKSLKNQTGIMINKSESLLSFLFASLKVMNGLRNSRKLEEYLKVARKLREKFKSYNIAFMQYYNTYVKQFVEYQQSMQGLLDQQLGNKELAQKMTEPLFDAMLKPSDQIDVRRPEMNPLAPPPSDGNITPDADLPAFSQPGPEPIASKPGGLPFPKPLPKPGAPESVTPILSVNPVMNELPPLVDLKNPKIPRPPIMPNINDTIPDAAETLPSAGVTPQKKKSNHATFLYALSAMENEHPIIIAKELIRYAKIIETDDHEMSQRLLGIAQNVLKG